MVVLTLCRYDEKGTLARVAIDIECEPYIAISHVWGPVSSLTWVPPLEVALFSHAIYCSPHKKSFLCNRLQSIVGTTPFWMDILCIDQTKKDDQIAIVGHIPSIYRNAIKTVAIRDGDGPQRCCVEASGDLREWQQSGRLKFQNHVQEEHWQSGLSESYLERLWPLQEILLSNTVHFVCCDPWLPEKIPRDSIDAYKGISHGGIIVDAIHSLGHAWKGEARSIDEFACAFLSNGIISRTNQGENAEFLTQTLENGRGMLYNMFRSSPRTTSKPRDYILATMPQFDWYIRPAGTATMSFAELLKDCQIQAQRNGYGFIGRIAKNMVGAGCDYNEAWDLSDDLPVPQTLGDFLKLLGGESAKNDSQCHGIVANTLVLYDAIATCNLESVINLAEEVMRASPDLWSLSHQGNELSKYGGWPNSYTKRKTVLWDYTPAGRYRRCEELCRRLERDFLIPEIISILDSLFMGSDIVIKGAATRSDWLVYRRWMLQEDPPYYKDLLLYAVACVSCGIGLSALEWVMERFDPVVAYVGEARVPGSSQLLGLVAKRIKSRTRIHAAEPISKQLQWAGMPALIRHVPPPYVHYSVVERWTKSLAKGRNLVIVEDNAPVGLLSDAVDISNNSDEYFQLRICALYKDAVPCGQNQVALVNPLLLSKRTML